MDMILRILVANGGKRVNLDYFPKLGRGHSATNPKCCDGKNHAIGRFKNAEKWAEERGLKLIETPSGEVVSV